MSKVNCWEFKGCGREIGGARAHEMGVCPAAIDVSGTGINGGRYGGRFCWTVAGTFCEGYVRGTFAEKRKTCAGCAFFNRVQREEGSSFTLITPERTANHALLEHFTSLASVVDAINALVYVADMDTHELLFMNPYGESLFGADSVGKRCYEVLQSGQTTECAFCTNSRLLVNGRPGPAVVWEFKNTVNNRWFLCIDKAIPWWDGRLVRMEAAVDITERKAAEQFHEDYVGLITHDLRNPLSAMMLRIGALEGTLRAKGLTRECEELSKLMGGAKRIESLIEDLLETTRLEGGGLELRKEAVELRGRVETVVSRIASAAERGRVEIAGDGPRVYVTADPGRLDRVIENYVSNALKFSSERPVVVVAERRGGEAVVGVRDQGRGVPPADLPGLFQRFHRGANAEGVKGSGLGLYHARLIIEAHGGRVWAESELGKGSGFYFALPLPDSVAEGTG